MRALRLWFGAADLRSWDEATAQQQNKGPVMLQYSVVYGPQEVRVRNSLSTFFSRPQRLLNVLLWASFSHCGEGFAILRGKAGLITLPPLNTFTDIANNAAEAAIAAGEIPYNVATVTEATWSGAEGAGVGLFLSLHKSFARVNCFGKSANDFGICETFACLPQENSAKLLKRNSILANPPAQITRARDSCKPECSEITGL